MFVVNSLPVAIIFCVITMLGWGSWDNTQKLAGKERWPFQLFYWDYAIGVFLFSVLFAATLGSFGVAGESALENLRSASLDFVWPAVISGAIFNLSNILLVVAIDAAGMSVAFPVGVGLALVIGTAKTYIETPKGDPALLFSGVALIVLAMVFSAIAHRRLPSHGAKKPILRERRGAEHFRQVSVANPALELHLPEAILRVRVTETEQSIELVRCDDVRDGVGVADDLDRR